MAKTSFAPDLQCPEQRRVGRCPGPAVDGHMWAGDQLVWGEAGGGDGGDEVLVGRPVFGGCAAPGGGDSLPALGGNGPHRAGVVE